MEEIHHSRPWITEQDHEAVSSLLRTSMLGQGGLVRELEQQFSAWLNLKDGVAVGSGSAGIVLSLLGLGIGADDEVVLPTYVCRSVLEAVLTVKAAPVFCDSGPDWVITAEAASCLVGPKTRAIIVSHLYGIFADIDAFASLGIPIIEDCAQALAAPGARRSIADVAVLSFHPTKCVTGGEGGMVLSSNIDLVDRMRAIRDGSDVVYSSRLFSPLSDLAASLVRSQLQRYELFLARRHQIAERYSRAISSCKPEALNKYALQRSMFYRFPLSVPCRYDDYHQAFAGFGISVRRGVDRLLHRGMGICDDGFPEAVRHFNSTVSIPIYPALTLEQERRCVDAIMKIFGSI